MRCSARAGSTLLAVALTAALGSSLYMLGSSSELSTSIFVAKLMYVLVLGLSLLSLRAGEREAALTGERGEEVPVELARSIARSARGGAAVMALASGLAGTAIVAVGVSAWALGLPIVSLAYAGAVGVRAQRVLRAGFEGVAATTTGSRIFVERDGHLVGWLLTSPGQVAELRERAIPSARVHKR